MGSFIVDDTLIAPMSTALAEVRRLVAAKYPEANPGLGLQVAVGALMAAACPEQSPEQIADFMVELAHQVAIVTVQTEDPLGTWMSFRNTVTRLGREALGDLRDGRRA